MPKRTNDFQAVVYFIKRHVAPNAEVVESALLTDRATGDQREVDVLVRDMVGGHQLSIGIEVRDRKRPATVEWVDEVLGKHHGLGINLTVLVSRSGFSKAAIRRSEAHGIQLVNPEDPEPIPANGPLADLRVQIEYHEVKYTGGVAVGAFVEGYEALGLLSLENHIHASDGAYLCTVGEFLLTARETNLVAEALLQHDPGNGVIRMVIEAPSAMKPGDSTPVPHCLRESATGAMATIRELHAAFSATVTVEQVPLDWMRMQGAEYGVGLHTIQGSQALIVTTDEQGADSYIRLTNQDGSITDLDSDERSQILIDAETTARMRARGLEPPPEVD